MVNGQTNDWQQVDDYTISAHVDLKKYGYDQNPYFVRTKLSCKMGC